MRPTHFISLRILPNNKLSQFYEYATQCKEAVPHLIAPVKYHITLLIMRIEKRDEQRFLETFKEVAALLKNHYANETIMLRLKGIGTFNEGRIVWTAPEVGEDSQRLRLFAESINNLFRFKGLVDGRYRFEPHMTLIKVDFKSKSKGVIPPEAYSPFVASDFGEFNFDSIELSSMSGSAADGYYACLSRIDF
ncbi:kinase A anchor protein [Chytridium lagenaria]|nr:kinase A anchor protein [Chytridium lagenaria]